MDAILELGLSNTLVAALLAAVAWGVSRVWNNPHFLRAMWLIVLIKLVLPPLVNIDWTLPQVAKVTIIAVNEADSASMIPQAIVETMGEMELETLPLASNGLLPVAAPTANATAPPAAWSWPSAASIVVAAWLLGSIAVLNVSLCRGVRFHRLLATALPASSAVQDLAGQLAAQIGLRRAPRITLLDADIAPFVWPVGRGCRVVLPRLLVNSLDRDSLTDVLLHELAHIRRGDHCIRWLEMAVATVHWWKPVMWLARREMRRYEEHGCDAWVAAEFPARRKSYAQSLLAAAELLLPCRRLAPLGVAAFSGRSLLLARIQRLLQRTQTKRLSKCGLAAAVVAATFSWSWGLNWVAAEGSKNDPAGANQAAPSDDATDDDAKLLPAILAAKQARFAVAFISDDGQAVRIVRSVDRANNEVTSNYRWSQIEVLSAKGNQLELDQAKMALAKRRVVVLISGTRPVEENALLWSVLAPDTPVIRLKSPGGRKAPAPNLPAKLRSIENIGTGVKLNG